MNAAARPGKVRGVLRESTRLFAGGALCALPKITLASIRPKKKHGLSSNFAIAQKEMMS